MKKILLLLLGLTIAVGATAGNDSRRDYRPAKHSVFAQRAKAHAEARKAKQEAARETFVQELKARAEAQMSSGGTRVIDQQPEGDVLTFTHFSYGLGKGSTAEQEVCESKIVIAPDGTTVYIQNAVIGYNMWLRGTLSGNKITVPMGQSVYEDGDHDMKVVWGSMVTHDGNLAVQPKTNVSNATYTIDFDNNTITLDNTNFEPTGPNFNRQEVSVGTSGLLVAWDYELEEDYLYSYSLECASYYHGKQSTNIIYDEPQGEHFVYNRTGTYIDSKGTESEQYGKVHVVYDPDGETVYIFDIVAGTFGNIWSWVKGTVSGDKITVPLGQYINYQGDYGLVLAWGNYAWDNGGDQYCFSIDPRVSTVTYTLDGDNLVMDNTGVNGDTRTGLAAYRDTYYYNEYEYFEYNTVFIGAPHVIYDQPSGYASTTMHTASTLFSDNPEVSNSKCWARIVFDFSSNTIYLQNPIACAPEGSWVKGTMTGNKITIPLGQYIYWDVNYGEGVKLVWGTAQMNDGSLVIEEDPTVTEVTFTANDDGTITLDNAYGGVDGDGATGLVALWVSESGGYPYCMEWDSKYVAVEPPTVITEQPEGEEVELQHTAGYYNFDSNELESADLPTKLVYDPDGETVYLLNPVAGIADVTDLVGDGTWVRGTINGNTITVPTGQYLCWIDEYMAGLYLTWGTTELDEDSYVIFVEDPSVTEVTYTIVGNTISLNNSSGGDQGVDAIGLAAKWDDGYFTSCVEWESLFTADHDLIVTEEIEVIEEEPEGELVEYGRSGEGYMMPVMPQKNRSIDMPNFAEQSGTIKVIYAPDGETVYLQDIVDCGMQYNRGTWVEGKVNEGRTQITVPLGQGVYYDEGKDEYQVLAWGSTSVGAADEYGDAPVIFTPDPSVQVVTFTIENNCLSMDNSSGASFEDLDALYRQYYEEEIDYDTFQERLALLCQNTGLAYMTTGGEWTGEANWGTKMSLEHVAVPANPVINRWNDYGSENGDNSLSFNLPHTDVDGYALVPQNVSISVYTDNDELFTFDAEHYDYGAEMTEIPFTMISDEGSYMYTQYLYFFRTNAEGYDRFFDWRIGIQVHYTVDGVKNSSDIVYLEVFEHQPVNPGDVDGNGTINVEDVTALIDYLLGSSSGNFAEGNADVNGNGVINVEDVTALIDMLLNGNS